MMRMPRTLLTLFAVMVMIAIPVTDAIAKTTYYKCDTSVYKLEESWIGKSKFYWMGPKETKLMKGAIIDKEYIVWGWEAPMEWNEKTGKIKILPKTQDQKNRTRDSASTWINRITGKHSSGKGTTWTKENGKMVAYQRSGVCKILTKRPLL